MFPRPLRQKLRWIKRQRGFQISFLCAQCVGASSLALRRVGPGSYARAQSPSGQSPASKRGGTRIFFRKRVDVLLLPLLAASSAACSSMSSTRDSRGLADHSRSCSSPIAGAKEALAPGTLLLLGEFHGTSEIPQFVGDLACEASLGKSGVHLGLEIPREEQLRIDSSLASSGTQ